MEDRQQDMGGTISGKIQTILRLRGVSPLMASMVLIVSTISWVGCDTEEESAWPGTVEADVDDLTGERTGLFRTYGPTEYLIGGRDTIPITLGYWCKVDHTEEDEPLTAVDGIFLKVSLPDTSLTTVGVEEYDEIRGTLGLLDAARMAVDGNLSAWSYEPTFEPGVWYLDGTMGFTPPDEFAPGEARELLLSGIERGYAAVERLGPYPGTYETQLRNWEDLLREQRLDWPMATDYVASHYRGRDTLGVELRGVVKLSLDGFDAAADSVRFWCPVPQSHHEWNAFRTSYFGAIDSLRVASGTRVTAAREQRAREVRAARNRAEAERIAREERAEAERVAREEQAEAARAARELERAERAARQARAAAAARLERERAARVQDSLNARNALIELLVRPGGFATSDVALSFASWASANGYGPLRERGDVVTACRAMITQRQSSATASFVIPCRHIIDYWK